LIWIKEKKELLKKIKSMNRQKDDFKPIINEIAKILDDKNLAWTQRLGKELGGKLPSGQLADFLGQEVMKSIWNA